MKTDMPTASKKYFLKLNTFFLFSFMTGKNLTKQAEVKKLISYV